MIKTKRVSPEFPGLFHCPRCREFKPRDAYSSNAATKHGIYVYCKKCHSEIEIAKRKSPFRSDSSITECTLCKTKKQGPLMWRFQEWRGEPVCLDCKEQYCATHNTTVLPKYFIKNNQRKCCRCKIEKSLTEFPTSATSKTGRSLYCAECTDKMILRKRLETGKPVSDSTVVSLNQKRCSRCGEVFDVSHFYKDKQKPGQLSAHCKLCMKFYNAKRYARNGSEYALQWLKKLANDKPFSLEYWRTRIKPNCFAGISATEARDKYISNPNCEYCGVALRVWECQLDHKIPRSKGGKNEISNIAISCPQCNRCKNAMTDVQFLSYLDELRLRLNQKYSAKKKIKRITKMEWDIQEIVSKEAV